MSDLGGAFAALVAIVVPLVLAWWLLGRSDRRRRRDADAEKRRGKMPGRH